MRNENEMEQIRLIIVSIASAIISMLTPIGGFLLALVMAWGFYVLAGMRSDGVVISNCSEFSAKKFGEAVVLLVLYIIIVCFIQMIMYLCGDSGQSIYVVKTATYIFIYVWITNGFKNLIKAYPKAKGLIIVYMFLRLDFKKMAPNHVQKVIDAYEEHERKQKNIKENKDGKL